MCDLHQNTLLGPTPVGYITEQITESLSLHPPLASPAPRWIKLYNSGNFFDPASIPQDEYAAIAKLCQPFSRVIIENHPRFGASRLNRFQNLIDGQLEIAVGLETVQPRWLERMGKQMTRDQFDRYAHTLNQTGVDLRVFLIVGVPGITVAESLRWAQLSVRHAIRQSARHISLIPARAGHGWSGQANELPAIELADLQTIQRATQTETCTITIDHWGLSPTPTKAEP
ncbi:Fe-S oxidoreductase [Planctomycetes bacterium K23_9]|uniref:Elp3/MiaA/NifB-like radical SAM core domain-containing protein n=1 Tax=Stieleria marina TaxID=1930275 RepID=A0A517NTY7_9BACT|nr:hypothetical protein K239x_25420 [Planctomycetes bacterium K23_9]